MHMPQMLCASCNVASEVSLVHLDIGQAVPPMPHIFLTMLCFSFGTSCKKICQGHPQVLLLRHWLRFQKRKAEYEMFNVKLTLKLNFNYTFLC